DSLRLLVESLLAKKKSMVSVLPKNNLPGNWSLEQVMIQPFRYAWEISLPRRWLNRPPVLSTCWIITAEALHAAGGFKAVASANSPESYFARAVAKRDGYSFLASDTRLGISCQKALADQRDTAIRTRYPQLHRRPELAGLLTLTELLSLVGPLVMVVWALVSGHDLLAALGFINAAIVIVSYGLVVELTYRRNLLRSLWLLPFAAAYDVSLLNYSMWQYEFGEVIWKGRNVCMPIMRAYPNLPKV
ncbi:MAG TPA: hypothetical protein VG604_03060, partial [Candidatus Saccharimonadales bacterium]|nr:hypothetical protein [Candidatus Saccharimonadales bacterium]